MQKIFYLPEAHTDFILAIIGEELGVAGVSALLFLYGLIALRRAARRQGARGPLREAAGGRADVAVSCCQALLNVFAVLGLAPLTGVPLPFVSYGSTNLIVLLAAMGLLLNVAAGGRSHAAGRAPAAAGERCARIPAGAETIVIAAGGTAGHVVPALAVADALRADGARVVFVGGERAEARAGPRGRLRAAPDPRRGPQPDEPAARRARRVVARRRRGRRRRGGSCASCAPTP